MYIFNREKISIYLQNPPTSSSPSVDFPIRVLGVQNFKKQGTESFGKISLVTTFSEK